MKNLMDKLTTYASLVGVVAAIGGGFYAWGEFNTRLSAIENKEETTYDVSGIATNSERIAVLEKAESDIDLKPLEEKISKNKDSIAERDKQISITQKEVELLKLEIEELKIKAKNPLAK